MAAETDPAAAHDSTTSTEPIDSDFLAKKLQQSMQITHISVEDMSGGCGQAFNAIIVSPEFEKKTLLARSRLVNGVLKEEISAIHAWTPRCLTPEQWEKEKARAGE
jgi:stress-induced morphogen